MRQYSIILILLGFSLFSHAQWTNGSGLEPNPPRTVYLNNSNQFRSVRISDGSIPLGLAGKLQVQANVTDAAQFSNRLVNFIGINMSSSDNILRLEATLDEAKEDPFMIKGIADFGAGNSPTYFYIKSSGTSSFNGSMNLLSINDPEDKALLIKNHEALWYNRDYFSWGFDGNWNRFANGITIGSATPPGQGNALRITGGENIFLDGGTISMNQGDLLLNAGDILSIGGDHIFDRGNIMMNTGDIELTTGKIVYKSENSKKLSFENTLSAEKSFIESGPNFMRLGDLNQLHIEIDKVRYFTVSKFFDANIFSKKVHFNPETPITFGTDPNSPDIAIQSITDDLLVSNVNSNGKIVFLTNEGDVLMGNTNTNIVIQDDFVGINELEPQHTLHVNGNVGITGEFFALSDERIKTNISGIQDAHDALSQLRPVSYNFIEDQEDKALLFSKKRQYGLLAQEVEQVLPNLITQHHSTTIINNEDVQLKGVNYNGLIAILIKGHQEQSEHIKKYEMLVEKLSKRVAELEIKLHNEVEFK